MTVSQDNIIKAIDTIDATCEDGVISFEGASSVDDVMKLVFAVQAYEDKTKSTVKIQFRKLSFEVKKELIRIWLTEDSVSNSTILLNVINFVKTYNTLSDEFFGNENIMFVDITEFLNLKLELKKEVSDFLGRLTSWYFSIFASVHKTDGNYLDNIVEMPMTFKKMVAALDFYTLSGMCSKYFSEGKPVTSVGFVKDAYVYVNVLTRKNMNALQMMDEIQLIAGDTES